MSQQVKAIEEVLRLCTSIHVDAQDLGVQRLIYALIYNENNIKHLPQDDAVIFRHYSAFEYVFKISNNCNHIFTYFYFCRRFAEKI